MKFYLLLFFVLITSNQLVAQTERQPWFFGLGINAVDYQTEKSSGINTELSALRLSIGRQIWGDLSAEASYALNSISDYPGSGDMELDHSAADIALLYSFGSLVNNGNRGFFHPYIGVGAGITWLEDSNQEDVQSNTLNFLGGINLWVNDRIAIMAQAAYKDSTDDFAETYIEYVVGIRYSFSFTNGGACFH